MACIKSLRALRSKEDTPWYDDFSIFFKISWAEVRFQRAQPRARTSSARQSILLIMEMISHTLFAIVALKSMKIHEFESWENQQKIGKFWKFSNFFENFSDFQLIVFSWLFELSWRSSSQKISPWSPKFNGVHQKFVRALVRALRAKTDTPWYGDFCICFKIS